jgi:hypothetical protein
MKIAGIFIIVLGIGVPGLNFLAGEENKPVESDSKSIKEILMGKDAEAVGRLEVRLPKERREMIQDLISIIEKEPTEEKGSLDNSQVVAAYLLGIIRAEEAVKPLANKIDFRALFSDELTIGHCFHALKRMGKPASLECLERLATQDGKKIKDKNIGRRELFLMVVRDVEGEEVAKFMLQRAIEKEKDAKRKANLGSALDLLEEWIKEREE